MWQDRSATRGRKSRWQIQAGAAGKALDDFGELVIAERFSSDFPAPPADACKEESIRPGRPFRKKHASQKTCPPQFMRR